MSTNTSHNNSNADDEASSSQLDETSDTKNPAIHRSVAIEVSSKEDIIDLKIRNFYESQVIASLGPIERGLRILKYYCSTNATPNLLREINSEIKANLSTEATTYFSKIRSTAPVLMVNQEFECDLYVKLSSNNDNTGGPTTSALQFLGRITEKVFPLGGRELCDADITSKWVLIEISESPAHLAHKLYQLERAIRLLPDSVSAFKLVDVGALVVLLNGKLEEAEKAVAYFKSMTNLKLLEYPVYVAWVPSRNIYAMIGNVEKKLEHRIDRVSAEIENLNKKIEQNIDRVEQRIRVVEKCIEHSELRVEQRIKVVEQCIEHSELRMNTKIVQLQIWSLFSTILIISFLAWRR